MRLRFCYSSPVSRPCGVRAGFWSYQMPSFLLKCECFGSLQGIYTFFPNACKRFEQILCGFFYLLCGKRAWIQGFAVPDLRAPCPPALGEPIEAQNSVSLAQNALPAQGS